MKEGQKTRGEKENGINAGPAAARQRTGGDVVTAPGGSENKAKEGEESSRSVN